MMKVYLILAVFIISFAVPSVTFADDKVCLKKVFHKYCLGGPVEDLPKSQHHDKSETGGRYKFKDGIFVRSFEGRVLTVMKHLGAGRRYSWMKYLTITGKLKNKYGEPTTDNSYFPAYADDPSDKETQISIGGGRIAMVWQQKGWNIFFYWDEDLAMLNYTHDSLKAKSKETTPDEGL